MHIDARTLENNTLIEGDICIVGAGAAGISIALDWIGGPYKVILLEGGGFEYDDRVQNLYRGEVSGQRYFPLRASRLHQFGGTTAHWAGMCSPFDNIDFIKRDWVPHSGWPINRADLDPFYRRAQSKLGLEQDEYHLSYWQNKIEGLIPFPLDENVIWNKMWQFSRARFGTFHKDAIVNASNIHLYTYAHAVDIKASEDIKTVSEVVVKNHDEKTHKVKAKHFILACGAIQNARLLLASNSQNTSGLGNNHDVVGRYFMEHLEVESAQLWLSRPFPMNLYVFNFEGEQLNTRAELAITEDIQKKEKILNGTASFTPLEVAQRVRPRMDIWQDEDPAKNSDEFLEEIFAAYGDMNKGIYKFEDRAFHLDTRIEQSPNPNSRVTINENDKDSLGVPRARLHWELTPLDQMSIRRIYEILGRQLGIAGIGRIKIKDFLIDGDDENWPSYTNGGWHHMGTARMGDDPSSSVVDKNCKVHSLDNLFVAGSACFTTAGAPNPTLTLSALSIRLSDHVKGLL